MIDPLFVNLIAAGFGLLFLLAALHKLSDRARFKSILAAYEIVPPFLLSGVSVILALSETLLGLAWLQVLFSQTMSNTIAFATASLLAFYGLVIAVNLARGRLYIDCGCSFGSTNQSKESQKLSWALVIRNTSMAAIALTTLLPSSGRELNYLDMMSILFGLLLVILVYAATNQLLINYNEINSWRRPAKGESHA